VLDGGAHWRHLANTIKPSMCGGDAAFLSHYFDRLYSLQHTYFTLSRQVLLNSWNSTFCLLLLPTTAVHDDAAHVVHVLHIYSDLQSVFLQLHRYCIAVSPFFVTDHSSGPGRAIGPLCLSVCICPDKTFEWNNFWPLLLARSFILTLSTSGTKVKVIGQSSRPPDDKVFLRSAHANVVTVPRTNTRLGDRSFSVEGPIIWNSLPASLRQADIEFGQFKRLLKAFLFGETAAH